MEEFNDGTQIINGINRQNSTSSQVPLTPKWSPAPKKCLSLYGLSMFERCLVILNVCIIVILLPLVFSSIHRLDKIASDINGIKDESLQQIKGICTH